jgi:WhiB family transcriptional regulator, redox-sensing transcriptional regulator
MLPLDIAVVRETIHKRTEYEATSCPLTRAGYRTTVDPARELHHPMSWAGIATSHESRSVAAMDWRHRAACRDEDPELFFPIGTSGPALLQVEQAKAVCRRCSVVDDCLQWALETGQDAGVWGGMSEEERRAVKRRGGMRVRAHSL